VVRWEGTPYHVAFWRNYVPIWFVKDVGFYFGWIEAAPYECLCDDDLEHMTLEVVKQGKTDLLIRWSMDLVTFGGRIYRGDTRVIEDYHFKSDGSCVRESTIYHGTKSDVKRNKNGYEISEFGVVNPPGTAPIDNVAPRGIVDRIIEPWGDGNVELRWSTDDEGITTCSGWTKDVQAWDGQIHLIQTRSSINPFVAFGRDSMPVGYYPSKYLVWGLTFEKSVLTFSHWPRKMDEYYLHENRTNRIRSLHLPTHTPIISCQFKKRCETIDSPLTFRWLIGMAHSENKAIEQGQEWLRSEKARFSQQETRREKR